MKILHVATSISKGGATQAMFGMIRNMHALFAGSIQCEVATTHVSLADKSEVCHRYGEIPTYENLSKIQLKALVARGEYDLIHWWKTTSSEYFDCIVDYVKERPLPIVITLCQMPIDYRHSLSLKEIEYADIIVYICKSNINHKRSRIVPDDAKRMIHFGTPRGPYMGKEWKGGKSSAFKVGRGSILEKCHPRMIEVFKEIDIPDSEFFIAGEGLPDTVNRIKGDIFRYGLTDRVHLLGNLSIEDWMAFLSSLDMFLYHLPHDAFSALDGTPQDAMLCGVPVVIYGPEGPKELIEHGRSGFVAETEEDIIHYCRLLYSDPKLRKEIGGGGRKRILENFNDKKVAHNYRELYLNLIESPSSRMEGGKVRTLSIINRALLFIDMMLGLPQRAYRFIMSDKSK